MADNLTLGRGKLFFSPYAPNATTGGVKGYFGNTPMATLTQAVTKLDHYSMEGGLKVKDKSIILQTDITMAFDTDNVDLGNLILWYGGSNVGVPPADAPAGLGTVAIIGKASAIYGALTFESDNPVGNNMNYWFPYVSLQPTGTFALKGDVWQTMSFMAECLKRDAMTERLYIFNPVLAAGLASSDATPEFTPASAAVATGGVPPAPGP